MQIGKVMGEVVSTHKEASLSGLKLLLLMPADEAGKPKGAPIVAVDGIGAGVHELVLFASGSSARQTEVTKDRPVDTVIMAIIDSINCKGEQTYSKNLAE